MEDCTIFYLLKYTFQFLICHFFTDIVIKQSVMIYSVGIAPSDCRFQVIEID